MKSFCLLLIFFPSFLFSEEYLKLILLSKEKEYVKEYDFPNIPEMNDIKIKEGFLIYYPNGKPPIAYIFNENKKEIFFEEKNLKKFSINFKECEYLTDIKGSFKIFPEKESKDFPFDKNYYFILLKDLKEISLKEGDRVAVHHHAPCMSCFFCRRGDFVQCETWKKSKIIPGGLAEYIVVPEVNLKNDTLRLPDSVSFEEGALVEPVACVVKSLKRANIKKGDTIVVIGLGVMGQIHIMLAKEFGAERVIGVDMVSFRLKKALQAGADYVIDVSQKNIYEEIKKITDGLMAQEVIVGPGNVNLITDSLKLVSRGGTLLIFTPTPPEEKLSFFVNDIYFNDITITTSYSCGSDDMKRALNFIETGIVRSNLLITHRFKLNETKKAYDITSLAKDSLKCMILF